jgi:hypothetical protein
MIEIRTPEQLEHYVAGFEAAVEAMETSFKREGDPEQVRAFMKVAVHAMQATTKVRV